MEKKERDFNPWNPTAAHYNNKKNTLELSANENLEFNSAMLPAPKPVK